MQSSFAGRLGQSLDFAMIAGATTVKHDLLDAFFKGGFGRQGTDHLGARHVGGERVAIRSVFAQSLGGGQRYASVVINELDVNVFIGKAHSHARTHDGTTDFFADAPAAQLGQTLFFFSSHFIGPRNLPGLKINYWTVLPSLRTTCSPA